MDGIDRVSELIFVVEETPEGGFTARALGESIFTDADDTGSLHAAIRDAVSCHFDEGQAPRLMRLHFVRDEVLALASQRRSLPWQRHQQHLAGASLLCHGPGGHVGPPLHEGPGHPR